MSWRSIRFYPEKDKENILPKTSCPTGCKPYGYVVIPHRVVPVTGGYAGQGNADGASPLSMFSI